MMYVVVYKRNGREERHVGTRAQCAALAEYVTRTFRVAVTMGVA